MGNRILLIDEDVQIRRVLQQALSGAGYDVVAVTNGVEALDNIAVQFEGYNAIVSEGFLTDVDGLPLLKTLHHMYPEVPLVVITGYGYDRLQSEVEALSPSCYFEKPVEPQEVLDKLAGFNLEAETKRPQLQLEDRLGPQRSYIMLDVSDRDRAVDILSELRELKGVDLVDAVRGEGDLLLKVSASDSWQLTSVSNRLQNVEGIETKWIEKVYPPELAPGLAGFAYAYQNHVVPKYSDLAEGENTTNVYLLIDVARQFFSRAYLSILFTYGVVKCEALDGCTKVIVKVSGALRADVVRHVLRKLAETDGIRRVRESTVINFDQ